MINLNLCITNPWSKRFKHVYVASGKLAKHKAWEFEVYRSNTVVELEARASVRQDHAGFELGLGLLSWTLRAQIYDTRHWDYETNTWVKYD